MAERRRLTPVQAGWQGAAWTGHEDHHGILKVRDEEHRDGSILYVGHMTW